MESGECGCEMARSVVGVRRKVEFLLRPFNIYFKESGAHRVASASLIDPRRQMRRGNTTRRTRRGNTRKRLRQGKYDYDVVGATANHREIGKQTGYQSKACGNTPSFNA